jgi:pimeloyl-ACP methyl ester carboxylesterase
VLLPVALLVAVVPPPASASLPCGPQSIGRTRCDRVIVPLDRAGAAEGRIGLSVRTVQLGQTRRKVRKEAVVFLAGGPGQAATSLAAPVAMLLAPLLRTRDLVAVDTRGTGRSSDLIVCPELETYAVTGLSAPESFWSCARRLGPAVNSYGTTDTVEDLEAVRIAGGYDRLLLVGVSYGTYTAQRYAAAHPDRVSGLVLDSAVDPTGADPFSLATFRALPAALSHACDRGACRGVTPDVRADLERVRARLPLTTSVDDGHGNRRPATIDASTIVSLVQVGDLDPFLRSALPGVLRRAAQGDVAPLGRLARETGLLPMPTDDEDPAFGPATAASISNGSYVATTCRDTHNPWPAGTPTGPPRRAVALAALAARSDAQRGGWSPEALVDLTPAGLCQEWPGTPENAPVGPAPDVPTLVLSGQDDTRTSPEEARLVAARHPGTTLLSVPGQGHSVLTAERGCVATALGDFAAKKRVRDTCHRPSKVVEAVPLAPSSPASLGSTPAGRARGVARATVLDALRTAFLAMLADPNAFDLFSEEPLKIRVAGLRSGSATLTEDGLRLDRMGYVPGTAVTGVADDEDRMSVVVRGKGLKPGRYTIDNPLEDADEVLRELGIETIEIEGMSANFRRALRRAEPR